MRSSARESVGGRNPDTLSVVSVITAGLDNRLSGQMEASSLGGPLFFLYTTSYIYLELTGAPALPLILLFPPTRHQGVHILRGGWCNLMSSPVGTTPHPFRWNSGKRVLTQGQTLCYLATSYLFHENCIHIQRIVFFFLFWDWVCKGKWMLVEF